MERVINEFRVIETDDGYRIEIKGDKDKLKDLFMGAKRWHRRSRGFGWRPFGFGGMHWGACCEGSAHGEGAECREDEEAD
jgi:hypothetical protein